MHDAIANLPMSHPPNENPNRLVSVFGQGATAKANPKLVQSVFNELEGYIFAYLKYRVAESDLDDINQTVITKVWQHRSQFTGNTDSHLRNWIMKITRNTLIDYYRKTAYEGQNVVPLHEEMNLQVSRQHPLFDLIPHDNLTDEQIELLDLRFWYGFNATDIAYVLSTRGEAVQPAAVRKRLSEIYKILRAHISIEDLKG